MLANGQLDFLFHLLYKKLPIYLSDSGIEVNHYFLAALHFPW